MSARDRDEIEQEAIAWWVRTRDAAFADWEGFTAWLEADAEHGRIYDAVALADDEIGTALETAPAAPATVEPPRVSRRWWMSGALAASVAAAGALLFTTIDRNQFQPQDYRTAPGERRSVRLADGSRVELNGATHLVVDGPRHARLEQGEALFTVVHDSSKPFELASGNAIVRDLGTVFDVVRTPRTFSVTVSEGAIVFNPDGEGVHVPAGKGLELKGDRLVLRDVDGNDVGGWRQGRLVYQGAPLAIVADDLSRSLGIAVTADPAVARQPFSGILQVEGKGEPALRGAAATLGVTARPAGEGWVLTR